MLKECEVIMKENTLHVIHYFVGDVVLICGACVIRLQLPTNVNCIYSQDSAICNMKTEIKSILALSNTQTLQSQ